MPNNVFQPSLKRIIVYGILILLLSLLFLAGVKTGFVKEGPAFEATIGLIAAYGIYLIVAYSDYFVNKITSKYTTLYDTNNRSRWAVILRGFIRLGLSFVILILVMIIFAIVPNIASLSEIYGALIAGWTFYLFERLGE